MPSDLRTRIIANMPAILEVLGHENRSFTIVEECGYDFRPHIIRALKRIADAGVPTSRAVDRVVNRVIKDARRLELSLRKLPPSMRVQVDLSALTKLPVPLPVPVPVPDTKAKATTARKLLAAELAFDLMADYGSHGVARVRDSPYLALAALLYRTATGDTASLERMTGRFLDSIWLRGRKGPRLRLTPSVAAWVKATYDPMFAARAAAVARWQSLEELLDQAFPAL